MSHELSQTLTNLRIQNIHDLSSRIFLLRFQNPKAKHHLLVDTGARCHLTAFARTTAAQPSGFVRQLRKLLGTRRVNSVRQIGTDRIIEFQFSNGLYRLYLEFYAGGNIVVTDGALNILALFRNVNEGAEHEQLRIGVKYNLELRQNYSGVPELTADRIVAGLKRVVPEPADDETRPEVKTTKLKKKAASSLRSALSKSFSEYPPVLLDHALLVQSFDASIAPEKVVADAKLLEDLLAALKKAQNIVTEITCSEISKGYIFAKKQNVAVSEPTSPEDPSKGLLYDDYQPFKPKKFEDNPAIAVLEFEGFNKTVDEFYSSIEGQRLDSRLQERESNARRKLDETRKQHRERLGALQQAQALNIRKAEAIQANLDRVQEATAAVNGLIAQGMDWVDIARLIEAEQGRGNPVAQLVKLPLKLYENTVTLLLAEPDMYEDEGYHGSDSEEDASSSEEDNDDEDDDEPSSKPKATPQKQDKRLTIDIDLSLSAWSNASQYYDEKKSAAQKEEKTAQASSVALKNAERKVMADLKKGLKQEKDILRPLRQAWWFEKFDYFISSDGYLILAGTDALKNDMLYSRYLKKGDVFVHADINGAVVAIVKNNPKTPDAPIPPSTLSQAGSFVVCSSTAWDTKAMMAAWWVSPDKVSKLASTGDLLGPGLFNVTGDKNFLPPAGLLAGIAIAFQISDDSVARHQKHRVDITESTTAENEAALVSEKSLAHEEKDDGEEDFADAKQATEDSDDEDFPDTKPAPVVDSDDEDFPDATPATISGSEDEDGPAALSNPLQTRSNQTERILPDRTVPESVAEGEGEGEGDDDATSVAVTESVLGDKSSRRHFSAKERRLLKKGVKSSDLPLHTSTNSAPGTPDVDQADLESVTDMQSVAGRSKAGQLPRGKRTKQRKAAAKYADQDEDDRRAALGRIGAHAAEDKRAVELAEKKRKEAEAEAQKQRRREQHLRVQMVGRLAEEKKRAEAAASSSGAEGISGEHPEPGEDIDLSMLPTLVGTPLPGDTILAAIPICAPWTALARYKYKIKLQPGSVKKGKASREALSHWQATAKTPRNVDPKAEDTERVWPREAELIAGMKDDEFIRVVPMGKVRIMLSGGGAGGGGDKKGGKGSKSARGGKGSKKK
jgi:predicted ribosome quality control (RQC) complex YloA/Tae2 family protein